MVDVIKTSVQQSLSQTSLDARAQAKRKTIDAPVTQQVSGSSDVSILSSKAQVKDMAEKPPLDIEAVGRIKEAIANGTYPIDLDQISDKLFENYLEMRK
ncbi:FlgM Negative regulator of flagellin synthesis (anti-sigma28 factor) [Paracoccaceae bacterium]